MPDNANASLLQQLRDVHLPAEVSWWPPAIGWWLLAILILASLFYLRRKLISIRQRRHYRKIALQELNQQRERWLESPDNSVYLQSVSHILRRSTRHLIGGNALLALSGLDWANAINDYADGCLDHQTIDALTVGTYKANPAADIEHIHQQLTHWLSAHKPTNKAAIKQQERANA